MERGLLRRMGGRREEGNGRSDAGAEKKFAIIIEPLLKGLIKHLIVELSEGYLFQMAHTHKC